jgi:hypothetical protein
MVEKYFSTSITMNLSQLRNELFELQSELDDLPALSDEAFEFRYGDVSYDYIEQQLNEDIAELISRIDSAPGRLLDPDAEHERGMLDLAFASMGDFYKMRI